MQTAGHRLPDLWRFLWSWVTSPEAGPLPKGPPLPAQDDGTWARLQAAGTVETPGSPRLFSEPARGRGALPGAGSS